MDINLLSESFQVRRLCEADVEQVYSLCRGNHIFYKYHPPFATRESIVDDMKELPPEKSYEDKFYVGFFDGDILVAVMDLIWNFPEDHVAFIGFFMVDAQFQGTGLGSKIVKECIFYLSRTGVCAVRLGVDKGNPQSFGFWCKNGFTILSEKEYIVMELCLA